MKKIDLKKYIKTFTFEIVVSVLALLFMLIIGVNGGFSKGLITNFELFRPEKTFILLIAFAAVSVLIFLTFFVQVRKRKLKSTKQKSAFAETVELSHKKRDISVTQIVYRSNAVITGKNNDMPKDIISTNPNIVELYFNYEEKLNI